jgi:hypothetical protein
VPKLIESAEGAPSATEIAPAMSIEASRGPVKEPESEKAGEQPKVLSPPAVIGPSKPSNTTTVTLRKRRMTSVLDAILESMKAPVPASTEATGEKTEAAREAITASMANVLAEAEPSKDVSIELVEESVPKKSKSPAPKAPPHGDLEYIVRHASRSSYHTNCQSRTLCQALAKDKILLSLVEKLKSSEAKLSAQAEAHKAEVQ